jgi:hypothetical protein
MAITRSQIARQLLAEGGAPRSPGNTTLQRVLPRMDGLRPGFYGPDAGEGGMESSFGADTYSDGGDNPIDSGEAAGGTRQQFAATAEALGTPQTPGLRENFMANQLRKQLDLMAGNTRLSPSFFANMFGGPAVNVYDKDFLGAGQKMTDVVGLDQYGMSGKDLTRSQNIQNALDKFQETGRLSQSEFETAFGSNVPTTTPGSDNEVMARKPMIPKLPTDIEPEESDYAEFVQRFTLPERFRLAEGGEPRQAYGLGKLVKKVTGAVKKVAKSPIGKAALIGTAAFGIPGTTMGGIFGRASFGGPAAGMFGFGGIGNALTAGSMSRAFGKDAMMGDPAQFFNVDQGFLGKALNFMKTPKGALTTIGGLTAATALLTPKQEEEVDSLSSRIADNTGIDVEQIRKEVQAAYASGDTKSLRTKYPFLITESAAAKAEGGRIGFENGGTYEDFEKFMMKRQESMSERQKEELRKQFENYMRSQDPTVEAAEGGSIVPEEDEMLNMGGNEMDLRGGGFVPLGEYEKKDDVPARLSKNEFVFTADAVRAAGGGSVDRGADLMYKTMKQLENKVV